ncbi:MAG: hypothetical protein Q8T08_05510 [Ignavibacteria bacterium]|nr:hypothetical protein [Ignavibacteria bacterium]
MNTQKIEKLIERYCNGETSLAEEEQLRHFFANETVPEHLVSLKPLFSFSDQERKQELSATHFDEIVLNKIRQEKKHKQNYKIKVYLGIVAGIAAAIILTITSLISTKSMHSRDSISDPELAYKEISAALMFVSTQINRGLLPVESSSSQLDKAMKPVKTIGLIDQTVNRINLKN